MFVDREDAGRRLAAALGPLDGQAPVVLGLACGGVPVAAELARALDAPLDVVVVRKLGVPHRRELAVGAIGEEGVRVLNDTVVRAFGVPAAEVDRIDGRERRELEHEVDRLRGGRAPVALEGRTVVLVDDGLATGATALAACEVVRARGAAHVLLAVPVGAPEAVLRLEGVAEGVLCLQDLPDGGAVSLAYDVFDQVEESQVAELLRSQGLPAGQ